MKFLQTRNGKIAAAVIVILLLVTGFMLFGPRSEPKEEAVVKDQSVQQISAEELGLSIESKPDKKAIKFKIAKAAGIESIEYEVIYEADSTAQEQSEGGEPRVQRGITGEAEIESGASNYESEWLDLGSCSKNVCRYDAGVEQVTLNLKIVKEGKTYSAEDTLEL